MHTHYNLNLPAPFLRLPAPPGCLSPPYPPVHLACQPGCRMQRPKSSGPSSHTMLGAACDRQALCPVAAASTSPLRTSTHDGGCQVQGRLCKSGSPCKQERAAPAARRRGRQRAGESWRTYTRSLLAAAVFQWASARGGNSEMRPPSGPARRRRARQRAGESWRTYTRSLLAAAVFQPASARGGNSEMRPSSSTNTTCSRSPRPSGAASSPASPRPSAAASAPRVASAAGASVRPQRAPATKHFTLRARPARSRPLRDPRPSAPDVDTRYRQQGIRLIRWLDVPLKLQERCAALLLL